MRGFCKLTNLHPVIYMYMYIHIMINIYIYIYIYISLSQLVEYIVISLLTFFNQLHPIYYRLSKAVVVVCTDTPNRFFILYLNTVSLPAIPGRVKCMHNMYFELLIQQEQFLTLGYVLDMSHYQFRGYQSNPLITHGHRLM